MRCGLLAFDATMDVMRDALDDDWDDDLGWVDVPEPGRGGAAVEEPPYSLGGIARVLLAVNLFAGGMRSGGDPVGRRQRRRGLVREFCIG